MVFNGDSDDQDICTLADKLVKTDDTDFPLKEKAMYANVGASAVWDKIMMAYGGWMPDDSNNSGQPEYATNLVSGTQIYPFATTEYLYGMEFCDSSGNWHPLFPITLEKIRDEFHSAETDFMSANGNPLYYRPVKNGIKLYPAPNFSVSSGLKGFISRDMTAFASTSTTQTPGWDSSLHDGLAIFMALQYAKINSLPVAGGVMRGGFKTGLLMDWGDFLSTVTQHYKEKFKQHFPKIRHNTQEIDQYVS
jgi:hypothetical protein